METMNDVINNIADYLPLSPYATQIGVTCIIAQVTLTLLFRLLLPNGPWTHLPAYTAHQVVALPLMIILTYIGWRDWFFDSDKDEEGATASDRIFGYSNPNDLPLAIGSGGK